MMFKFTWITTVIVVLLVVAGVGAFAQTGESTGHAAIALTHSAQDVGAIDVYIDHNRVIEGLQMTDPAYYTQIAPGHHLIDVFPAGENVVLIKTTELAFEAGHTYQLALIGLQADWSVELVTA